MGPSARPHLIDTGGRSSPYTGLSMKLVTVSRLRRVSRGALIGLLAGALFAGGASAARWLASRPARPGAPGPTVVVRSCRPSYQAVGRAAGWRLDVCLAPGLRPLFGGAHLPPDSRLARPGLPDVRPRLHEAWLAQRPQIEVSGPQVLEALA